MTLSTLTVHMELSRYNVWIHINKFGTYRVLDKHICEYALIWSQKEKNKWWLFKIIVLDMEGQYNFRPSPLISSQLAVTASSILWEDEGLWNFMSVEGFLNFILALYFWYHCALPFWEHSALAEKVSNLKCSLRGFPSYRGLIWFSCGLGWPRWWKFLDIEGQYHFRPFPIKLYIILYHCFNYASEKVNTSPEIEFASFEIGSRKLPAVGKEHSIQTLVDNVVPNEHTKVTATHIYIYIYVRMYVCMYV